MGKPGRSHRTPGKLMAFRAAMGREAGIFRNTLARNGWARTQIFLDLNSGPAEKNGLAWSQCCTTAIAARHVMHIVQGGYPAEVRSFEIIPSTRRKLIANLAEFLPNMPGVSGIRWTRHETGLWTCGDGLGTLTVEEDSTRLHRFPGKASVFVAHDPNSFGSWSMGDPVFDSLDRAKYLTTGHWIGFNAGSVKRMASSVNQPEQIERWKEYCRLLNRLLDGIGTPGHRPSHDIVLFRVLGDSDQWAYLLTCHTNFVPAMRADILKGMGQAGLTVDPILRSAEPERFAEQIHELTVPKEKVIPVRRRTIKIYRMEQYDNEVERQDPSAG